MGRQPPAPRVLAHGRGQVGGDVGGRSGRDQRPEPLLDRDQPQLLETGGFRLGPFGTFDVAQRPTRATGRARGRRAAPLARDRWRAHGPRPADAGLEAGGVDLDAFRPPEPDLERVAAAVVHDGVGPERAGAGG